MPKVRQQFLRLAGARHADHGELVDFDAFDAQFARDRVAQTAFGIMIFDGDDGVVGLFARRREFLFCRAA